MSEEALNPRVKDITVTAALLGSGREEFHLPGRSHQTIKESQAIERALHLHPLEIPLVIVQTRVMHKM